MVPIVIEHRLHALSCAHCGETTRSPLPLLSVHPGGYGERLSAVVALLSGTYRQSHQQVKTCLAALFGIEMSTGSINRLRREVSEALAEAITDCSTDVYLVVAGAVSSGTQRPVGYYQDLAANLGIADRCRWLTEFIPEAQVGNLFNACDAILLTYSASFQSASGVLNVAAAYHRPCIASGGQGNLQTMVRRYGLGVWVEPDSWEAIGAGIQQWLKGIDPPCWEDYERDNSWARNAELVYARFWGNTCN